jgi:hypothetical protein
MHAQLRDLTPEQYAAEKKKHQLQAESIKAIYRAEIQRENQSIADDFSRSKESMFEEIWDGPAMQVVWVIAALIGMKLVWSIATSIAGSSRGTSTPRLRSYYPSTSSTPTGASALAGNGGPVLTCPPGR